MYRTRAWLWPRIVLIGLGYAGFAWAQAPQVADDPPPATKPAPQKRPVKDEETVSHRLPPHYAKLVDETQRAAIYKLQDKYADDIKKLQEQIDRLKAKRDTEIRDVLTPAQQKKLDELLSEPKATAKTIKTTAKE